jgi:hypothetical protein
MAFNNIQANRQGVTTRAIGSRNTQAAVTAQTSTTQQIESLAQQLANQIIRERELAARRARLGRVFTTFDPAEDVIPNQQETVTKALFSNGVGNLLTYFTSSTATAIQKTYYQEVFNSASTAVGAASQFSIAFGDYNGSGSADLTGNLNNDTPTRAVYKQYAQLVLEPNDYKFTVNGVDTNQIYVVNFNRARFREKLDPGNVEFNIGYLSGSQTVAGGGSSNAGMTGSNVQLDGTGRVLRVIDDSGASLGDVSEAGLVYNLVSGSIVDGIYNPSSPTYIGLLYPQHGYAVFNANTLDTIASFETVTGSLVQGDNAMKMFTAISGAATIAQNSDYFGIQARSSEQVKSTYYYVRVKNGEYNYSNNPSFVTGSLGQLRFSTFVQDPQVYITTVGLYNDRRELLAVAKLSKPILKAFTREALVKVKLDF